MSARDETSTLCFRCKDKDDYIKLLESRLLSVLGSRKIEWLSPSERTWLSQLEQ